MNPPSLLRPLGLLVIPLVAACSTPPPPNTDAGRTPSSAVDSQKPVVKRIGDRVQVIQTATRAPTAPTKTGSVMLDVMCPVEAPNVLHGGCSISDGTGLHRLGVLTGFYPLLSAEGGEGYRCLFDDAGSKDELTAMAFCKLSPPKPRKRRRPVGEGGAPAAEGAPAAPTAGVE